jgi:hypothetical protein
MRGAAAHSQQKRSPEVKRKTRVATVLTGVVATAVGIGTPLTPAGEAQAAPACQGEGCYSNWEISLLTNVQQNIYQVQICGYNQLTNWVCTPDENISSSYWRGFTRFYKNNWWWHGHVRLWWDQHTQYSVNNCSLSPDRLHFAGTFHGDTQHPGNWVQLGITSGYPAQGVC